MTMPPSDTFFTQPPHWEWLIIFYFFFGGLSAGSYVFAAMLDLFGRPADRPLARLGYIVAFIALLPCPPLLIIDLDRPDRFWHMLLQSHTMAPMFKVYSPMSIGSWALLLFGAFATASFLGAMAETKGGFWRSFGFFGRGTFAKLISAIGTIPGFFVAGYTGVLLAVTNRPIWADSPMLGAVFLLSGAASAAALLIWLGKDRVAPSSLAWLMRLDVWLAIVEIVAIVAMVILLGPVARAWMNVWGVLLLVGVVVLGLILPIVLHSRPLFGDRSVAIGALLALLAGGLLLRIVVILSSEAL
jgi:formate-dependent nitrite reductase membrane component NrfD